LLTLAVVSGLSAVLLVGTTHPWLVVFAAILGKHRRGSGRDGQFLALEQVLITREVSAGRILPCGARRIARGQARTASLTSGWLR